MQQKINEANINPEIKALLASNAQVQKELSALVKSQSSSEDLIGMLKRVAIKKTYKQGGKKHQTSVVTKNDFLTLLCSRVKHGGISQEVLDLIEPVVCLTGHQ